MRVSTRIVELKKRFPLAISRGTSTGSHNVFVTVEEGGHSGIGECAPGTGSDDTLAPMAQAQIAEAAEVIGGLSIYEMDALCKMRGMEPAAQAGLDTALWDLLAKRAGLPLYELLGLPRCAAVTSVTVGLNPPDVIRDRVPVILREWGGRALKIKLGSPDGIERDREGYEAAREAAAPFGVKLRVDANGGWSATDAVEMIAWLADRGCDYVEQPLEAGQEAELPHVFENRKLPIFLDESVRCAADVPPIADRCDGVNLKLMKSGGITEGLRVIAAARAHSLQTMIGCMGESSIAIAAAAAISGAIDHIDLDSHFNLDPDPGCGLEYREGVVLPPDRPGHGASLCDV